MVQGVLILSQKRQDTEYLCRLKKGIEIFKEKGLDYMILSSESVSNKNIKYLCDRGISAGKILTESNSRDTIGEALFVKQNIIVPYKIKELYVISSDYHINYRVRAIFDYVFGADADIIYIEVKTDKSKDPNTILDQIKSLEYFTKIISTSEGEDLLEHHPLYNKKQE